MRPKHYPRIPGKYSRPIFSRMNCLIENEYTISVFLYFPDLHIPEWIEHKYIISFFFRTYIFPNELPNWKRTYNQFFFFKPIYSRMNCLIENKYIISFFFFFPRPTYSRMNCLIENEYISDFSWPINSQINLLQEAFETFIKSSRKGIEKRQGKTPKIWGPEIPTLCFGGGNH